MLRNKPAKLVACGPNEPVDMDLIDILVSISRTTCARHSGNFALAIIYLLSSTNLKLVTIAPPPLARIAGISCFMLWSTPRTLTLIVRS
jgi:hypothetical protein